MADLWGAAGGIDAGLERDRLTKLTDLSAMKTMADLAELPGKLDLQKAHARFYNAEAADKETEAGANKYLGDTARNLSSTPPGTGKSIADPGYALAAAAFRGGYVKQGMKLLQDTVTIADREAQLLGRAAVEDLRKARTQEIVLQETASLAEALDDPATYQQRKLMLAAQPNKTPAVQAFLDHLPETYDEAQSLLDVTKKQAIREKDAAAARAKKLVSDAEIKAAEARVKASTATAAASEARRKVSDQLYKNREKNDGDNSSSVRDLRRARTAAVKDANARSDEAKASAERLRTLKAQQLEDKLWPVAPTDPSKREVGQQYRSPTGAKGIWTKEGWVVQKPVAAAAPRVPADEVEDDDDDTGDEE